MKESDQIQSLEQILRAETRSFVRYLVEAGAPQVLDDADGKVQGFLDSWGRDSRAACERLDRLLRREDVVPIKGSWPLGFTQYNFLRYAYLLQPLRARMEAHARSIEDTAAKLPGWPGAETAVKELLASHRSHLARIAALEAAIPTPAEAPGERRQTSANWW